MPYLAAFVLGHVAAHLFTLGLATAAMLTATAAPDWKVSAAATTLLMAAVFVVSDLLSDNAKARLVFWRWSDPLPGSLAFSQYMHEDGRIDPARLTQKYGALPTDPKQQNRFWYAQVYKLNRDKAGVAQSHGRYLLLREMTAISAALALPLTASVFTFSPLPLSWKAAYAVGLGLQYVFVSLAAANAGVRLVKNALAEACG